MGEAAGRDRMSAAGGRFAHDFPLDRFQRDAAAAIDQGRNVLVAAPTGSGKTVVGEMAVSAALDAGLRAFYTAPIKALSNQKFHDLATVLGRGAVGLLTGDHSINPHAPVVVMTTEVLRNMVYGASAALEDLGWVVLDEVHFLQDAYRGPVWEEVLIHTPARVRFACLSATVSNSAELGAWITAVRGPTTTVVEEKRPVHLEPMLLVGDRHGPSDRLVPLLVDGHPNPDGARFDVEVPGAGRGARGPAAGAPRSGRRSRFRTPRRVDVVERLEQEALLPAIVFIFSRAGCEEAAAQVRDAGIRLTTAEEAARIRDIAEAHVQDLEDADLGVLGWDGWAETLGRGIAAHHAGMVPAFREAVEQAFTEGLVKVVFATETLALGINMPARSVVIERLTKFTGDGHDMLTPSQFTQLTGRAGRRGIDEAGTAVVLWSPFVGFERVAALAASREFTLSSAFRPTYNMAVNLVDRHDREGAHAVLARSFAQFQADRSAGRLRGRRDTLAEQVGAEEERLASLAAAEGVTAADAAGYAALVAEERRLRRHRPGGRASVERSMVALRPGDVVQIRTAEGQRLLCVVSVAQRSRSVKVEAVTARGRLLRLDPGALGAPLHAVATVSLPVPYAPRDPSFRREVAARLRRVDPRKLERGTKPDRGGKTRKGGKGRGGGGGVDLGAAAEERAWVEAQHAVEAHPLHAHPRRHDLLTAADRVRRDRRDLAGAEARIARRGTDLVARFDAVLGVLEAYGHVEGWSLTPSGRRLRRIYHECDLLVSLALDAGLLEGLDAPAVAALASCLTYEHRSSEPPPPPDMPTRELRERFAVLCGLAGDLQRDERAAGLALTREPQAGFARAAWGWAAGRPLADVLTDDMSGGDFVRNTKQLVDLLRQLAVVVGGDAGQACDRAAELLRRDVVDAGTPE
jgi:ATP-dependent RNA helicase HelY